MSLILASQSPRRAQLLEALGLPFKTLKIETQEKDPSIQELEKGVLENAFQKAVVGRQATQEPSAIVIAADTLVAIEGQVLGKPNDASEATRMLELLSGKKHQVVTGLVLINSEGKSTQSAVSSWVVFKKLAPTEIQKYVETKEPYDKAGSYAVQGLGTLFIERIEGSYTNIMGFPIEQFLRDLEILSEKSIYEWFAP